MMRIAERPTARTDGVMTYEPFMNNVYMTVVTITTVGYGDIAPVSTLGKCISITSAFWGGFIISLLIVSVEGIFSLSKKEQKAFQNLLLVKKAARCLVTALKYRVIQKKMQRNEEELKAGGNIDYSEYISQKQKDSAKKKLLKRLARFTEVATSVKKLHGENLDAIDPVEELGHELIEMNIKMEKMSELITSCYTLLKA